MLVMLVNGLFELIYLIVVGITAILPDTPFEFEQVEWGTFGQLIGYAIPVAKMFTHLSYIVIAVGLYYVVRHLLRLIKAVQ